MSAPLVSILMVARNSADFIDDALLSARAQTVSDMEIVVVDDGSTDGTLGIVHAHMAQDSRIRLIPGPKRGLSPVRNVSLHAAKGRFAAILDSDDLLHPDHLKSLLAEQMRTGARICSANMVEFASETKGSIFAEGASWNDARYIGPEEFVRCGMIGTSNVSLGYLKPLLCLDFFRNNALHYNERLRIGEDFDLVLRAMLAGADYRFLPEATYYYRKHASSTSHRLTTVDLLALIEATQGYYTGEIRLDALIKTRLANLEGARRQVEALAAIKAGHFFNALRLAVPHRHARMLTLSSLKESVWKRFMPRRTRSQISTSTGEEKALPEQLAALMRAPNERFSISEGQRCDL